MNMTNEEIRIKIAETIGARLWNNPTASGPEQIWAFTAPSPCAVFESLWVCGEADCLLPNYPESLDACAEFEATLTDEEQTEYWENLVMLCNEVAREKHNFRLVGIFYQITATPLQRCLAYLKTKGIIP